MESTGPWGNTFVWKQLESLMSAAVEISFFPTPALVEFTATNLNTVRIHFHVTRSSEISHFGHHSRSARLLTLLLSPFLCNIWTSSQKYSICISYKGTEIKSFKKRFQQDFKSEDQRMGIVEIGLKLIRLFVSVQDWLQKALIPF